ncbi:hypothetical protein GCM10020295_49350 [Streptomyces cinereospinus]
MARRAVPRAPRDVARPGAGRCSGFGQALLLSSWVMRVGGVQVDRAHACPSGQGHGGEGGVDAQFAEDVLHVGAHGVRGEVEALGDGLAPQARDHAPQHLPLARGEGLHQPLALGAVPARGGQFAQHAGEQGGRQMRLVAQHAPDDGEQPGQRALLGDPAARPGLQGQRRAPGIVLLGEDDDPHPGLRGTDPGDQRDAVHHPVHAALRHGQGGPYPGDGASQVGVDEEHVEPAALGGRALQAAQRGGTAAGRGDVDVGLGGERRGEGLGEDAVVVDDQDSDANHETPFP